MPLFTNVGAAFNTNMGPPSSPRRYRSG